jgi:glutamate carboxypeptidase
MKAPIRLLLAAAALTLCGHSLAQKDDALLAAATAEQAAVVKTLERLVNIETGTGTPKAWPPWATCWRPNSRRWAPPSPPQGRSTCHWRQHRGPHRRQGGQALMLMAHMDTVYVKGTLAKAPFRIDGNRAFGPGIADDKGGISVILHTLKLLKARGFDGFGRSP